MLEGKESRCLGFIYDYCWRRLKCELSRFWVEGKVSVKILKKAKFICMFKK